MNIYLYSYNLKKKYTISNKNNNYNTRPDANEWRLLQLFVCKISNDAFPEKNVFLMQAN